MRVDSRERQSPVPTLLAAFPDVTLSFGALPSADGAKDDLRQVVVAVLDELGVEHPLARDARRRLAAALY